MATGALPGNGAGVTEATCGADFSPEKIRTPAIKTTSIPTTPATRGRYLRAVCTRAVSASARRRARAGADDALAGGADFTTGFGSRGTGTEAAAAAGSCTAMGCVGRWVASGPAWANWLTKSCAEANGSRPWSARRSTPLPSSETLASRPDAPGLPPSRS
ncbi:MAG: hypothetical protein WDN28_23225 [Chthoniobacter sp.]